MRRLLSVSVLVSAVLAVMLANAPAAGAAGDRFAGMWENTALSATWVVTPVSDGVYHIEESFADGCAAGPAVVVDTAAIAVGDVLMVDWVSTECLGGPAVVGTVFPGRTITLQPDGSAVHKRPVGADYTMVRTTTEFFDVSVGKFYTDAVTWLACEGITTGTSPTTFSPDDSVTRAQMAAFLWRYAVRPEPAALDTPFADVPAGEYYSEAVAWLVEEDITNRTSPTTFSPDEPVTRGQMAAFLWRHAGRPEPASLDTPFADVPAGEFYAEAVAWLVEQDITKGTSATTFSPDEPVTRGQMATFLWRRAGEPPI